MKMLNAISVIPAARPILFVMVLGCSIAGSYAQRILPVGTGISGSSNWGPWSMVEYDGKLVIGGRYINFNGHARNHLQAWDGTQHYDLPGAFENIYHRVYSLAVFENDLIAAGVEPDHGNIARWNGAQWSSIGSGLASEVRAVKVMNGSLHALSLDSAVHRWNGSEWQVIGQRFNGPVLTIAEYNGTLYAGGEFTGSQDGTPLARLASCNGNSWQPAFTGFNDAVRALMPYQDKLYIGGAFTATDVAQPLPGWCVYNNTVLEAGSIDTGPTGVNGFGTFADDAVLVFGQDRSWVLKGSSATSIEWRRCRAALQYDGTNYLGAGDHGGDYRHKIMGIAKVDMSGLNHAVLDVNQIRATITPTPALFHIFWGSGRGFEVPINSGHDLIEMVFPFLRGEANGSTSYSHYSPRTMLDDTLLFAGPGSTSMDEAFYMKYHQVWHLHRPSILAHQQVINESWYEIPSAIANWPAHGELDNGEPEHLAPFADLNGNNVYEPELGEYPKMKGDASTYHLTHSVDYELAPENFMPVDISTECYAYVGQGPAIDHTVFASIRFINRTGVDYSNARFSLYTDMSIGTIEDDLVGSDPPRDLYFNYNGSDVDPGYMDIPGYSERPPAIGVKFLNVQLDSHRRWRRESSNQTQPDLDWLNEMMDGTQNGMPFMHGGVASNHQFPGGEYEDDLSNYQGPLLNDPRSMGASGPFNFAAGDTLCFDIAFIYARTATGGAYASLEALKLRADSVQAFYDSLGHGCNGYPVMTDVKETDQVHSLRLFPNPATDEVRIVSSGRIDRILIYDMHGKLQKHFGGERSSVPINDLANGMYLIKVVTDQGTASARLVKH